jgi:monoamine oxidase
VARWLDEIHASPSLRAGMRGFRGFFLADPETLSLLPVVEQFADFGNPAKGSLFRLPQGNDALATRIAERLKGRVLLNTVVRRVVQRNDRVSVIVDDEKGRHRELDGVFFVCALPATTARDVVFAPALPEAQHEAIARLRYGCATRLLLQFERRFWNRRGRPLAFGTDLPVGAFWDGAEEQSGPGVLSFLAGGQASGALQDLLRREGERGAIEQIQWLGSPSKLLASQTVVWEDDPWALGGYAYFDPSYDPLWREWLARPFGRITFAGEHMSIRWQGYMNGAVESGRRAAAEVAAMRASVPDALRL